MVAAVYGVGPAGARKAYQQGARSLQDLCSLGGSYSDRLGREECLRILPDLLHRIPRRECEFIAELVRPPAPHSCWPLR